MSADLNGITAVEELPILDFDLGLDLNPRRTQAAAHVVAEPRVELIERIAIAAAIDRLNFIDWIEGFILNANSLVRRVFNFFSNRINPQQPIAQAEPLAINFDTSHGTGFLLSGLSQIPHSFNISQPEEEMTTTPSMETRTNGGEVNYTYRPEPRLR